VLSKLYSVILVTNLATSYRFN